MVLIMIKALTASSMDFLHNTLPRLFSHDIIRFDVNPVWICRLLVVIINIPAIFVSTAGHNVIGLFLVVELSCARDVITLLLVI